MSGPQPRDAAAGFTLLELMVALAIIAMAATIGFAAVNRPNPALVLDAAARQFAADLRLARAEAIRSNRTQNVMIDVDGHRYWTEGLPAHDLGAGVRLDLEIPDAERFANRLARVRFFPDGTSGGAGIRLTAASTQKTVVVDWITGEPRVDAVR